MNKHVLVIGGKNSSWDSLRALPLDLSLVQTPKNLSAEQSERAKNLLLLSTIELNDALAWARDLHRRHPIDAVLSFNEECLEIASRIGESLGISCNPLAPVDLTRDKLKMRESLIGSGLRTVRFRRCHSLSDIESFLRSVDGPIVVKPAMGSGSRGVAFVEKASQLESAWEWVVASDNPPAIAEEFIEGPEFSVESISLEGQHRILAITEKITTEAPHFVETGHQMPARLEAELRARIERMVVSFLDRIGQKTGPCHTEFRLHGGEPCLIESQTRFGGDQIWEMVELTCGVRLAGLTAARLAGIEGGYCAERAPAAAIRFFANEHCEIESLHGLDESRQMPGVVRVECSLKPGSVLGPLKASSSRQGYVLALGDTVEEAVSNAERAWHRIRITSKSDRRAG